MSIFTTIETDADTLWDDLKGSKAAALVDNVYNAVVAELETVGTTQLETAVETIGVAAIGGLSGGAEAAIAAGVAAAVPAFEAAGKTLSAQTINVLASSVVTQLQAQQAAAVVAATPPAA